MDKKTLILVCVIGLFLFLFQCEKSKNRELKRHINYLDNENKTYINKKGEEVTELKSTYLNSIKDLKKVNDSLYSEVKKTKGILGVTKFKTKTKNVYKIKPIIQYDTVYNYDTSYVDTSYSGFYDDEWSNIAFIFSKDSIFIENINISKYTFVHSQKKGIFVNNPITVKLTNHNPNSRTVGIDSYTFKAKQKRINLSIQSGVGYSFRNKNLTPYIGVGMSLNLN